MNDLRDLYQELILDHGRRPRNFREIEGTKLRAEGYNPLCGDRISVTVELDGDRLADVAFHGAGCAICMASASIMTEELVNRPLDDAERLFSRFRRMVTGEETGAADDTERLAAFAGVAHYPMRVKCAMLAWHTWRAAIRGQDETVTTE